MSRNIKDAARRNVLANITFYNLRQLVAVSGEDASSYSRQECVEKLLEHWEDWYRIDIEAEFDLYVENVKSVAFRHHED